MMPSGFPWEKQGILCWLVDLKGNPSPKKGEKRAPLGNWGMFDDVL